MRVVVLWRSQKKRFLDQGLYELSIFAWLMSKRAGGHMTLSAWKKIHQAGKEDLNV